MEKFITYCCSLYKKWDKHEILAWEAHQLKGMRSFMLVEGVLKWGTFSFVIFSLASLKPITLQAEDPWRHFVFTCLLWFFLSLLYGFLVWKGTEYSYSKNKQKIKCFNEHKETSLDPK